MRPGTDRDRLPADHQPDAESLQSFLKKLNKLTGIKFQLPTETEWRYAASGGKYTHNYRFPGSDNLDEVAVFHKGRFEDYTVGMLKPNELGLYDMAGGLMELCTDDKGKINSLYGGSRSMDLSSMKAFRYSLPSFIPVNKKSDISHYMSVGLRLITFIPQ